MEDCFEFLENWPASEKQEARAGVRGEKESGKASKEKQREKPKASPEEQREKKRKHKKKAVKAVPCSGSTQLQGSVRHGNEKVGEKRRFREACDAGGEGAGQGLRGEGGGSGGEKLENKAKKEARHKQSNFEGNGKDKAVEKKKRPLSELDRCPRAAT